MDFYSNMRQINFITIYIEADFNGIAQETQCFTERKFLYYQKND